MPISLSSLSHLHYTPLRPIFLSLLRLHLPPFILLSLLFFLILFFLFPLLRPSLLSILHFYIYPVSLLLSLLLFSILFFLPLLRPWLLFILRLRLSRFIAPLSYVLHSLLLSLLPPPPSSALSPARPPPTSPIPLPFVSIVLIVAGGVIQGNCLGLYAGLAFIITKRSSHPTAL